MIRRNLLGLPIALVAFTLLPGSTLGQQAAPTLHRYLSRAVFTEEGVKNLQKQPPTALKAGIVKYVESLGGKLESWYFDFGTSTGWAIIEYPDEIAATAGALTVNAAGYARVTLMPLLTAEEADKAVAKAAPALPPQKQ
jgi:uncharacterized protein with GYD domain